MVYLCRQYGLDEVAEYWHQVVKMNDYQKNRFAHLIDTSIDASVENATIGILGWAFKKNTNDSRESAAIYVAAQLLEKGYSLSIYDPMVSNERILSDLTLLFEAQNKNSDQVQKLLDKIQFHSTLNLALAQTSVSAILTEWDEFKEFNWKEFLNSPPETYRLFDGRNLINKAISNKINSIGN